MTENPTSRTRRVAVLWIVAAVLAFAAVAIGLIKGDAPRWSVAAGGVFCLVMGVGAWTRQSPTP